MRLLLIQLEYLGDVLLATPAVGAARRQFPDARIEFLTRAAGAQALAGNRDVDEVLLLPERLTGRLRLMRELRRRGYDAVVDFQSKPSSALMVAAAGAPMRVGVRGRGPRNLAYTRLLPRERGPVYMALQKLRMLAPLGVDAGSADLRLRVGITAADRAWAAEEWRRLGLEDRRVAAVSAVARLAFKQWGAGAYAALCDRLSDDGYAVLLTHGPGEEAQVAEVASRTRAQVAWRHRPTTIPQLAALYERCEVWVGNDGGPKHVAAAAGVPTVSVIRWQLGPVWSDAADASRQRALDSAPPQGCDRRCARCAHLGCLGAVAPGRVAEAALALAARTESSAGAC